jgi:hypothetical protein
MIVLIKDVNCSELGRFEVEKSENVMKVIDTFNSLTTLDNSAFFEIIDDHNDYKEIKHGDYLSPDYVKLFKENGVYYVEWFISGHSSADGHFDYRELAIKLYNKYEAILKQKYNLT